jgi:hypothetical protein
MSRGLTKNITKANDRSASDGRGAFNIPTLISFLGALFVLALGSLLALSMGSIPVFGLALALSTLLFALPFITGSIRALAQGDEKREWLDHGHHADHTSDFENSYMYGSPVEPGQTEQEREARGDTGPGR